jgi:hypothetical protein
MSFIRETSQVTMTVLPTVTAGLMTVTSGRPAYEPGSRANVKSPNSTCTQFLELSLFRQRSQQALKQKARCGALFLGVAAGYVKTARDRIEKDPDLRV